MSRTPKSGGGEEVSGSETTSTRFGARQQVNIGSLEFRKSDERSARSSFVDVVLAFFPPSAPFTRADVNEARRGKKMSRDRRSKALGESTGKFYLLLFASSCPPPPTDAAALAA